MAELGQKITKNPRRETRKNMDKNWQENMNQPS